MAPKSKLALPVSRINLKTAFTFFIACNALVFLVGCAGSRPLAKNQALVRAAEKGETKEVYRLIEAGADVNGRDADGWTPYMAASSMGQLKTMRVLVAFGAKTVPPDLYREPGANKFLADR